ncbi:MAG TPA: cell division protein ZapB [Syntrophales bacterium]|nr:cell division protein ZapB [Syntrophales bacterium]HPX56253.1 cell division protein ZapB [Syntrophales bacterium]HQA82800.1 cell division protein ZapB [Syntrophales bacterium]
MEITKFGDLEEKIKNILTAYAELKERNQKLEEQLKNKDLELQETYNKIRGLNEERDTIRSKVDSLLDLLQDINAAQ